MCVQPELANLCVDLCSLLVNIITLVFASIGGFFALHQWNKGLTYKRTEIVSSLIETIRKDNTISTVIDIIDWNEEFYYDGKFHVNEKSQRGFLEGLSGDDLFIMIGYTIEVFSYICYLKAVRAIKYKDMRFFEYEIRRLAQNPNIANYLYSLYHWSEHLEVNMTFSYFVDYCLKKKYFGKDFKALNHDNAKYKCYLCF